MRFGLIIGLLLVSACGQPAPGTTYRLYRESPLAGVKPMHVASFDASDGDDCNRENCVIAQELFSKQPGVTVRYWCEKS